MPRTKCLVTVMTLRYKCHNAWQTNMVFDNNACSLRGKFPTQTTVYLPEHFKRPLRKHRKSVPKR